MGKEDKLETCQPDARFPEYNVSGWCFTSFVDHKKCTRLLGSKHAPCDQFYKCYRSICPNSWVAKWEDQIANGTFPVDLPPPKDKK